MSSLINKILPATTTSSNTNSMEKETGKSSISSDSELNLEERVIDFENKSLAMVDRLDETKERIAQCTDGER